eukprot:CAMPEP_0172323542 /NCGR_PEP_ID=MMETSP1058-20130122/48992_1 /TAXON_ID=83371 /ORGANISM="Detonula confervacea, Strain CCMP 353" /LENGTH=76 /DNA_ID=CAMNT_0013039565 /DNA_START=11 /DNA_END=238 /DNA_ORIENTATION=-
MNQGANDALNIKSADAPFEWLTNFRSLRHLVLPSRIVFGPSVSSPSKEDASASESNDRIETSSERQPTVQLNALHV